MKPKCDLCGSRHEPYQAHVWPKAGSASNTGASNTASNKVTASNNASNTGREESGRERGVSGVGQGLRQEPVLERIGVGDAGVPDRQTEPRVPKQRWSREAYNAYQREYMRRVRAK
jgi:hypothetical protein